MSVWGKVRQEFIHAFALPSTQPEFAAEDLALLEKLATFVVKRSMAAPALLFLESVGPLNFLGSQVLHGLKPFLELLGNPREMARLAIVLERRDSVDRLIALIQDQLTSST